MTSTTPAPIDCHEAFPGSVRCHSWNSCPDCGGHLEAPTAPTPTADPVAVAALALATEAVEMGADSIADMAELIDENEAVDAALASVGVTVDTVPCAEFMDMVAHVIAAADVALAEGPR